MREPSVNLIRNPDCDGTHCRETTGEVRKYVLNLTSNAVFCLSCWAAENIYRYGQCREEMSAALGHTILGVRAMIDARTECPEIAAHWPQQNWFEAERLVQP